MEKVRAPSAAQLAERRATQHRTRAVAAEVGRMAAEDDRKAAMAEVAEIGKVDVRALSPKEFKAHKARVLRNCRAIDAATLGMRR
jgi:hypothetical protein